MTSSQQQQKEVQQLHSHLTLPEIEVSDQLDWNDINFSDMDPSSQPSPLPPPHESPPQQDNNIQQQQQQQQQQHRSDSDNESITTGLTRALSLSRQLSTSATTQNDNEEENMRKEVINISTSNPSHLFWVPASQHPEIAPAEFEKYVDSHGLMIRKKSVKRRQSILSVYFTASDQQKYLDDLAKMDTDRQAAIDALEGSKQLGNDDNDSNVSRSSDEESKRKLVMRRSVSLHLPTAGDYVRNVPDLLVFDRNSSPLDESRALVPKGDRPLLRRGARTNFKRNSSVTMPNRPPLRNRKSESDYIDDKKEEDAINSPATIVRPSSADGGVTLSDSKAASNTPILEEEPLSPVAELAEDVRDLCIAARGDSKVFTAEPQPIIMSRSLSTSTAVTSGSNNSRKSTWSWAFWSDEKSSKKSNKIDPVEEHQQQQQHQEPPQQQQSEGLHGQPQASKSFESTSLSSGGSKRFTLSSLFSRKSKHQSNNNNSINNMDVYNSTNQLNAPKDFQLNQMFMTRLPLHVERAIYKLSHIKLANPRRPLHEQVLISNQMFWYLSVIASNPPSQQQQQQQHVDHYQQQQQQQQQQKKKPRKLVKKHRPPPPTKQKKESKLTNNVAFMANNNSRESSTGFVVPENYLNPKYQQKQPQQQKLKKKSSNTGLYSRQEYEHKQSDSSDEDDDEDVTSSDEEDDRVLKRHKEDDNIPLALYKAPSHRVK
ncbi:unnamed protein product [Mucor hiemalis]